MWSRKYVGPKPTKICRLKKKNSGALPLHPPRGGLAAPPLTPLRARHRHLDTTTHAKNITHTQHSPTCCFLCTQGVIGLHSQQCPWILYTKRTSQCSQILLMNLTFFKVSTFISNTFFSSTLSLTN